MGLGKQNFMGRGWLRKIFEFWCITRVAARSKTRKLGKMLGILGHREGEGAAGVPHIPYDFAYEYTRYPRWRACGTGRRVRWKEWVRKAAWEKRWAIRPSSQRASEWASAELQVLITNNERTSAARSPSAGLYERLNATRWTRLLSYCSCCISPTGTQSIWRRGSDPVIDKETYVANLLDMTLSRGNTMGLGRAAECRPSVCLSVTLVSHI